MYRRTHTDTQHTHNNTLTHSLTHIPERGHKQAELFLAKLGGVLGIGLQWSLSISEDFEGSWDLWHSSRNLWHP